MALTSGTKLGPYEIQSPCIPRTVHLAHAARAERLDGTVAVKILPSHLSDKPEAKQRFDREARSISYFANFSTLDRALGIKPLSITTRYPWKVAVYSSSDSSQLVKNRDYTHDES